MKSSNDDTNVGHIGSAVTLTETPPCALCFELMLSFTPAIASSLEVFSLSHLGSAIDGEQVVRDARTSKLLAGCGKHAERGLSQPSHEFLLI